MITQNRDLYIKLFNTLSGVRFLMSCILSQLNSFCSSLVKSYYAKVTFTHDYSPFARYDQFTRYPRYWISSKRSYQYTKTFRME